MLDGFVCSDGGLGVWAATTYCFRESPPPLGLILEPALGPAVGPQKILVVITRSVRRNPSSLITRPLEIGEYVEKTEL